MFEMVALGKVADSSGSDDNQGVHKTRLKPYFDQLNIEIDETIIASFGIGSYRSAKEIKKSVVMLVILARADPDIKNILSYHSEFLLKGKLEGEDCSKIKGGSLDLALRLCNKDLALFLKQHHSASIIISNDTLSYAALAGSLDLVKWLIEDKGATLDQSIFDSAVMSGSVELVKWLTDADRGKTKITIDQGTLDRAAYSGSLDIVKWLCDAERGEDKRLLAGLDVLLTAARSGSLGLFRWLYGFADDDGAAHKSPVWPSTLMGAVHPDRFWRNTLNCAAHSGRLELVQWLRSDKSLTPDQNTLRWAALSGSVDIVEWLIEDNGATPGQSIFDSAVISGSVELVKWLLDTYEREQNLIIDQTTLRDAARSGSLGLVKWLRNNKKLTPDQDTLVRAAESGSLKLVQWLYDNRAVHKLTPNPETFRIMLSRSSSCITLEISEFLILKGLLPPSSGSAPGLS